MSNKSNVDHNVDPLPEDYLDEDFSEEQAFGRKVTTVVPPMEEELVDEVILPKGERPYSLSEKDSKGDDYIGEQYDPKDNPFENGHTSTDNAFLPVLKQLLWRYKIPLIILVFAIGALVYFKPTGQVFWEKDSGGSGTSSTSVNKKITTLLTTMYETENLEAQAVGNSLLLESLSEELQKDNDIRDVNVYSERYGMFYNEPTTVDIEEVISEGSMIVAVYTVTSPVASPIKRILIAEYDKGSNKFTKFDEYNSY